MKKNHNYKKLSCFIAITLFAASSAVGLAFRKNVSVSSTKKATDTLAACEIVSPNGTIKFECIGEEGICSETYLGHTLTCTGQKKTE